MRTAARHHLATLTFLALVAACAHPRAGGRTNDGTSTRVAAAVPSAEDTAAVRATLDRFIADFNNLDSARFSAHWRDDASAILPFADTPHRLDGRTAILERFMRYFAEMRAQRSGPPFLHMVLQHVRIDLPAAGVAVATYEFEAAGSVRNRALVFTRDDGGRWRILLMHGS